MTVQDTQSTQGQSTQSTQGSVAERLEMAELRLAKAIGRLEGALETQAETQAEKQVGTQSINVTENAENSDELNRLQSENKELKALLENTSLRLDGAIMSLKNQTALDAEG